MSARKTNRRQFLAGKSATTALGDMVDAWMEGSEAPAPPEASPPEGYLLEYSRRAMACQFAIFLNAGQSSQHADAAFAALDLVEQLEAQLSIYRETSEISHINRSATEGPVKMEARLAALLALAERISRETGGAYDISAGPLVRAWGFVRRQGALPHADALAAARQAVGQHLIRLDAAAGTIQFLRPGMELNLGSIGKGYALDRAAEVLAAAGTSDCLLHGGQSSVLARGGCVESGHDQGWSIGLPHPYRRSERLGQIRLRDQALSTSGSATQFFEHQGRRLGHILDPRSGLPVEGVLSTTAIAATAAEADALSTAFYVLGPRAVEEYCASHADVGAIFVLPAARAPGVDIQTIGLATSLYT
ncbi:MAG TPA: FAD:protein FMN transferase [Pirellulales bacterium]|jgi:thiamine biosynthesis lipoprotein|nr:FAD:protein FMN transferase [Pirellulales bacterium]